MAWLLGSTNFACSFCSSSSESRDDVLPLMIPYLLFVLSAIPNTFVTKLPYKIPLIELSSVDFVFLVKLWYLCTDIHTHIHSHTHKHAHICVCETVNELSCIPQMTVTSKDRIKIDLVPLVY